MRSETGRAQETEENKTDVRTNGGRSQSRERQDKKKNPERN